MTLSWADGVGVAAAILTTLCWVPQAAKTIRSRDTRGISLAMQLALNVGILLWLAYGLLLGSLPLIGANLLTLSMTTTILVLKLRHG